MDTFEIGDYVTIKSSCRIISAASHLYYLQMWNAIGRVIPNYNGNSDRIFVRFQFNDSVVDGEVDGMFPADELELADIAALSSETPAEPGSDAKDEYTRDEEQARLIARIRELEEAIEQIRTDANEALGEWSPVGFTHIPENLEPYWFIRRAAEKALGEDYVTKALADAQEERG